MMKYDSVRYALGRARDYARAAKDDLAPFPPSEERETLGLIADYVVDRDR